MAMNWLMGFFSYCWQHRKPMGWDGYCSVVCPECAKTPEYRANIEEYLRTH